MVGFITESGSNFEATPTVGGFRNALDKNDFEAIFSEACDDLGTVDFKEDINTFIKNPTMVEAFKDTLLSGIQAFCENQSVDDIGNFATLYDQVSDIFDGTVDDLCKESTRVGVLLPIKAIDLPICVKSHVKAATKDILQTETTKIPVVKKQIERTWIVDEKTKKRWQYPQCLFSDEYKEIFNAGKGIPLDTKPVKLPLFNYDIVAELTDAEIATREKITIDIKIDKVYLDEAGTKPVVLRHPIRVNLADSAWVGGIIDETVSVPNGDSGTEEVHVQDVLSGFVDFHNNTTTITSASGQVKAVSFNGRLSNEFNERTVTFDYDREDKEWKIEDGFRADIPFSLEELEDTQALLDIDLYKKTYTVLGDLLTQMEDNESLDFLDEEFKKYDGVELDPLDFNPFISKRTFDCDSTTATTALPAEFISTQLKFLIDRFVIDIADKAKIEDMTFVVYGNPRYISLLDPHVNWVVRQGSQVGGIKLNYSYGIMNSGDVKIQVVSSYKINAKTHKTLRFIPYPMNEDTITFKHYKHSTHILTAANSAYRSADRPGGSYTYLVGTSRYKNIALQGIQGDLGFRNDGFIVVD